MITMTRLDAQLKSVEFRQELEKRWEKNDACYIRALSINHQSKAKHTYVVSAVGKGQIC